MTKVITYTELGSEKEVIGVRLEIAPHLIRIENTKDGEIRQAICLDPRKISSINCEPIRKSLKGASLSICCGGDQSTFFLVYKSESDDADEYKRQVEAKRDEIMDALVEAMQSAAS